MLNTKFCNFSIQMGGCNFSIQISFVNRYSNSIPNILRFLFDSNIVITDSNTKITDSKSVIKGTVLDKTPI